MKIFTIFNPSTINPLRKKFSPPPLPPSKTILERNHEANIHFNLIIFPNGVSANDYGLPTIKTLKDIDKLPKFEVIRYLQGFDIECYINNNNNKNNEEQRLLDINLRNLLKDRLIIETSYSHDIKKRRGCKKKEKKKIS